MSSPFLHISTLGRASTAIHRAVREILYYEYKGEVGNEKVTAINFTDKISEFGFHGNTSFFGLDAPHHTPTQDAKQGAKMTDFSTSQFMKDPFRLWGKRDAKFFHCSFTSLILTCDG